MTTSISIVQKGSARTGMCALGHLSIRSSSGPKRADAARVPYPPGKEVQVKGQLYRVALTASLLVILVEGLGAGSKWG